MQIANLDQLTPERIDALERAGGRFVYFEYCVSLIFVTFRQPTDIVYVPPAASGWGQHWPYTFMTFFLGWWGLPWGLLATPQVLLSNLSGGQDVTAEVRALVAALAADGATGVETH